MAKKKNKNIIPLTSINELIDEIKYSAVNFKTYFKKICEILPVPEQEKLMLQNGNDENLNKQGLVYIFVINGYIFKIGQSIKSIKNRIQSYNCGKVEYRIAGTNSTTNYFVLQSLLKINAVVEVYAYFPETLSYTVFDKVFADSYPPAKRAENMLMEDFIKTYNKKPIGCTQR